MTSTWPYQEQEVPKCEKLLEESEWTSPTRLKVSQLQLMQMSWMILQVPRQRYSGLSSKKSGHISRKFRLKEWQTDTKLTSWLVAGHPPFHHVLQERRGPQVNDPYHSTHKSWLGLLWTDVNNRLSKRFSDLQTIYKSQFIVSVLLRLITVLIKF